MNCILWFLGYVVLQLEDSIWNASPGWHKLLVSDVVSGVPDNVGSDLDCIGCTKMKTYFSVVLLEAWVPSGMGSTCLPLEML